MECLFQHPNLPKCWSRHEVLPWLCKDSAQHNCHYWACLLAKGKVWSRSIFIFFKRVFPSSFEGSSSAPQTTWKEFNERSATRKKDVDCIVSIIHFWLRYQLSTGNYSIVQHKQACNTIFAIPKKTFD